jgi:hypothetical protein
MMSDKVSLKNSKDKKFEEHQQSVFNLLEKTAKNLFEDKHFHEEFKGVFAFSSFLKIVSSVVSFCTGFIAIQIATKLLFGYWASGIFAFTVCVSLEGIKAFFWRINSKWFLKYRKISKAILFALVGLHLVSLVFSAYGGWMLPTMVDAPSVENVPKVNEDSISQPYLLAIALIDEQLRSNNLKLSENQSNSTIRTFNKNIETLLSQKTAKETALNLAILSAKEERSIEVQKKQEKLLERKKIRNEEIETARFSCLIASVFFELLFVICSCFCVYYLFRLNIDLSSDEEQEQLQDQKEISTNGVKTLSKQQGHQAPPILEQKTAKKPAKIGFHGRCLNSKKEQPKECVLDGCSETWTKGAHNKKYCSNECRQLAHQLKKYNTSKQTN